MILNRRNDIFIICPFNEKKFFNNEGENVIVRRISERTSKRLVAKEHENSYRINTKYIEKVDLHIENIKLMKKIDEYINRKDHAFTYIICTNPFSKNTISKKDK